MWLGWGFDNWSAQLVQYNQYFSYIFKFLNLAGPSLALLSLFMAVQLSKKVSTGQASKLKLCECTQTSCNRKQLQKSFC